jgi:hypothetical protein
MKTDGDGWRIRMKERLEVRKRKFLYSMPPRVHDCNGNSTASAYSERPIRREAGL